ncbi:Peroxyureidoacrylate/ureidoacrylate amidohydrolase RutB [compost metagenome]
MPNPQARRGVFDALCYPAGDLEQVGQSQNCRKLRTWVKNDADLDVTHLARLPPILSITPVAETIAQGDTQCKQSETVKGKIMSNRAILVVDLQNEYWPSGNFSLEGIEAAAANAARVMDHARAEGDLVVNIRHEMPGGPLFVPGSAGAEINDAVRPAPGEPVITKNFPNSFRDTGLSDLLKKKGIEEVVVVGAMSHMCVDATVRAANDLGYKTMTVHDACATRDLDFNGVIAPAAQVHATLMSALSFAYGEVVSTDAFLAR